MVSDTAPSSTKIPYSFLGDFVLRFSEHSVVAQVRQFYYHKHYLAPVVCPPSPSQTDFWKFCAYLVLSPVTDTSAGLIGAHYTSKTLLTALFKGLFSFPHHLAVSIKSSFLPTEVQTLLENLSLTTVRAFLFHKGICLSTLRTIRS